jgi:hypothetical protein
LPFWTDYRNYSGGIRFSSKKFVGDLGEFCFYQQAKIFSKLTQSQPSNEHDFSGLLLPGFGFASKVRKI